MGPGFGGSGGPGRESVSEVRVGGSVCPGIGGSRGPGWGSGLGFGSGGSQRAAKNRGPAGPYTSCYIYIIINITCHHHFHLHDHGSIERYLVSASVRRIKQYSFSQIRSL